MTKKFIKTLGVKTLLNKIIENPGLVSMIQGLDAQTLGKLIDYIGLEDSGEIIALATTDQIKSLFDFDLWRNENPGTEEHFDADRFAIWLEVMSEIGTRYMVEKISELDDDFLVMAISHHVLVINVDELAIQMSSKISSKMNQLGSYDEMLEKALENGLNHEFEEFRVISMFRPT